MRTSLQLFGKWLAVAGVVATFTLVCGADTARAHCQVPCGIYDDAARVGQLREDAATIAKATTQIRALSSKHDPGAFNQSVRWTTTKDEHASRIITTIAEYFLTQKVKPVAAGSDGHEQYLAKLGDHHAVMVAAMKTKQQVSPDAVASLEKALDRLAAHY